MNMKYPNAIALSLVLLSSSLANGQEAEDSNIEEIIVIAELSRSAVEELNTAYGKLIEEDEIFAEVVGILTALQARLAQF